MSIFSPSSSFPVFSGIVSSTDCLSAALDHLDEGNALAALNCLGRLPPFLRERPEARVIEVSASLMLGQIVHARSVAAAAAQIFDLESAALTATATATGTPISPATLRSVATAFHMVTGMFEMIAEAEAEEPAATESSRDAGDRQA